MKGEEDRKERETIETDIPGPHGSFPSGKTQSAALYQSCQWMVGETGSPGLLPACSPILDVSSPTLLSIPCSLQRAPSPHLAVEETKLELLNILSRIRAWWIHTAAKSHPHISLNAPPFTLLTPTPEGFQGLLRCSPAVPTPVMPSPLFACSLSGRCCPGSWRTGLCRPRALRA